MLLPLLIIAAVAVVDVARTAEMAPYRLPGDLQPEHYDLTINTNMGDNVTEFSFDGHVEIWVKCLTATDRIVLNSFGLAIDAVRVSSVKPTGKVDVSSHNSDDDVQMLSIQLSSSLRAGKMYRVYIAFASTMPFMNMGYFRTQFTNAKTKMMDWMSLTQFEPIFARRAFPCFDEPAMKATFTVTMGHPVEWTALSSMPMVKQSNSNRTGWINDHFAKSIKMSTYILAFAVTRFASRELSTSKTHKPIVVRAWTHADLDEVDYALEIAVGVLETLEAYIDYELPVDKYELMAVPGYMAAGMENWGLIVFNELFLLSSDDKDYRFRVQVGLTIAHELCHQYFGNLVTLGGWEDFWLNEGFTVYMTSRMYEAVVGWGSEMGPDKYLNLMTSDLYMNASSVVGEWIWSADFIGLANAVVVYTTGASLLRMTESLTGEDRMRKCLQRYVKSNAFGHAETRDWWHLVASELAGPNETAAMAIEDAMIQWTRLPGMPEVTVQRNYKDKTVTLTQQRFQDKAIFPGKLPAACWPIPIVYRTSQPDRRQSPPGAIGIAQWMQCQDDRAIKFTLPQRFEPNHYFLLNPDLSVPYRVRYDKRNWQMLLEQLAGPQMRKIPPQTRAHLLDEYIRAAPKKLFAKNSSPLVRWLRQEDDLFPWTVLLDYFIRHKPTSPKEILKYEARFQYIVLPVFTKVISYEPHELINLSKRQLQQGIVQHSCERNLLECDKLVYGYIMAFMTHTDWKARHPVPKDLRYVVYCQGVHKGGPLFLKFLNEYGLHSDSSAEKFDIQWAVKTPICQPRPDTPNWMVYIDSRMSAGALIKTYLVMLCRLIKNIALNKFNVPIM